MAMTMVMMMMIVVVVGAKRGLGGKQTSMHSIDKIERKR